MSARDLAVRFTAPERAELRAEEAAAAPLGEDEVAGRSLISLVSAGTELACYRGLAGGFPRGTGYATVFAVEEVGAAVRDVAPGDRAFCLGSHRLLQRHPRSRVVPLPAGLAPERAVFSRMMGITMSTLVTTAARPPDRVLVTGLGVVGLLGAQVFARCGYQVTACEVLPARRELASALGVTDVRERAVPDGGSGRGEFALVLECSGHEAAVLDGCRAVRRRGEVVLVGVPWERRSDVAAFDVLDAVFRNYVVLRSGWEWELPHAREDFRAGSLLENYRAAMCWIAEDRIRVDGLAELRSPADCGGVYAELLGGRAARLSTIFDWRALRGGQKGGAE